MDNWDATISPPELKPEDIFKPHEMARIDSTRTWVDPAGYRLDDRLWRSRAKDRAQIDDVLREGLAKGASPLQTAKALEGMLNPYYQPRRDPKTFRVLPKALQPKGVATTTPRQGPGKGPMRPRNSGTGSYAARRLARTETTRAFGDATIQAAKANPVLERLRWRRSAHHHDSDQCDLNAERSSRDQPPGVYWVDELPQYPDHPHEMCTLNPYVTNQDLDSAVQRLRHYVNTGVMPDRNFVPPPGGVKLNRPTTKAKEATAKPEYTAEHPYRDPQFDMLTDEQYKNFLGVLGDPTGKILIPKAASIPDVLPPFVKATTMKEAEDYGRSLGIPHFNVGNPSKPPTSPKDVKAHVRAANATNGALRELLERGVKVPDTINVISDSRHRNAAAYYSPASDSITVNAYNTLWTGGKVYKSPEEQMRLMREQHVLAGDRPEDIMIHEVGHYNHLTGRKGTDPILTTTLPTREDAETAQEISNYAKTKQVEYVAEAYVLKFKGIPLTPKQQELYERMGGPEIP